VYDLIKGRLEGEGELTSYAVKVGVIYNEVSTQTFSTKLATNAHSVQVSALAELTKDLRPRCFAKCFRPRPNFQSHCVKPRCRT